MTAARAPNAQRTPAEQLAWLHGQMARKVAPKARAKPGNPERRQQEAVVAWLRRVLPRGSKVFAIVNEAPAQSKTRLGKARFYQARRKAGVLDDMTDLGIILHEGRTVWLEMKAATGVVKHGQHELHADLRALGHQVGVGTCIDTARHVLRAAGVVLSESAAEPSRPAHVRVAKPRAALPKDRVPW